MRTHERENMAVPRRPPPLLPPLSRVVRSALNAAVTGVCPACLLFTATAAVGLQLAWPDLESFFVFFCIRKHAASCNYALLDWERNDVRERVRAVMRVCRACEYVCVVVCWT